MAEGMKLYELDAAYKNFEFKIDDKTGEIINLEEFETIESERRSKLEYLAVLIKNLDAEISALKAEKLNMDGRIKVKENRRGRIAEYLQKLLDGEELDTPKALVKFRKSEQTVILQEDRVPDEFVNCEVVRKPVKDKIKKYLKSLPEGDMVSWARIDTKINMTVK